MDRAEFCKTAEHVRLFYLDTGFSADEADAFAENWKNAKNRVAQHGYGHGFRCVECQVEDTFNTAIQCHHGIMMAAENICFRCSFWLLYMRIPHPNRAIVEGRHYVCYPISVGETRQSNKFAGFAGSFFQVHYFDGRIIWSQNTWHQGEIPERFKYAFPDSARFVYDALRHAAQ